MERGAGQQAVTELAFEGPEPSAPVSEMSHKPGNKSAHLQDIIGCAGVDRRGELVEMAMLWAALTQK